MTTSGQKRKAEDTVLVDAPRELVVLDYAESHAAEIRALTVDVETTGGGKKLSQKLPRHMRRRALSHNVKRLPRKVRNLARNEYSEQEGKAKSKPPSRKHRRRPRNLLEEYSRRQRNHVWLETHIWHAKRFKMVNKWGYRLPLVPTDKSTRAAYRATSKHCLLQDQSYMCCIEVSGLVDKILDGLAHMTHPDLGTGFGSKMFISGTREGSTVVYTCDQYPWNAVGQVSFLWKPEALPGNSSSENRSGQRCLWIWCHPSIFLQLWKELLKCYNISADEMIQTCSTNRAVVKHGDTSESNPKKSSSKDQDVPHNIETGDNQIRNTNIISQDRKAINEHICLLSLNFAFSRFKLTGPESNSLLYDTLEETNIQVTKPAESQTVHWWQSYYSKEDNSAAFGKQQEFWDLLCRSQSPAELPPHCVVSLTVRDPRLGRPMKRIKITSDVGDVDSTMSVCKDKMSVAVSQSALWEDTVRAEVKQTKPSDLEMNKLRSQQMVPGTPLELGERESRIPVLLIQQPGAADRPVPVYSKIHSPDCNDLSAPVGHGSGWDIILPAGWSMPFWLALVFRGARTGGLKDAQDLGFEHGAISFPIGFPDTCAGVSEDCNISTELEEQYLRKPPAKRLNYIKLGVASPFCCPWDCLVKGWLMRLAQIDESKSTTDPHVETNGSVPCVKAEESLETVSTANGNSDCKSIDNRSFYVLRNRKILMKLHKVIQNFKQVNPAGPKRLKYSGECHVDRMIKESKDLIKSLLSGHSHALVPVKVSVLARGVPTKFASICIPSAEDLASLNKDGSWGGPQEPLHPDPVHTQVRWMKIENKKTKEKTKKEMKNLIKIKTETEKIKEKEEKLGNIVDHCCREVIGYLVEGGFSLSVGRGTGLGFCSVLGLCKLLSEGTDPSKCLVLIRNVDSPQYRFAALAVSV